MEKENKKAPDKKADMIEITLFWEQAQQKNQWLNSANKLLKTALHLYALIPAMFPSRG